MSIGVKDVLYGIIIIIGTVIAGVIIAMIILSILYLVLF